MCMHDDLSALVKSNCAIVSAIQRYIAELSETFLPWNVWLHGTMLIIILSHNTELLPLNSWHSPYCHSTMTLSTCISYYTGLSARRSSVKPSGLQPSGFTSLLCQYLPCGTREARVITNLLHEQLAKGLFLCCVPKRDTRLLGIAYCAASLLGRTLKRTGCSISNLTWTEDRATSSSRPIKTELLLILKLTAGN